MLVTALLSFVAGLLTALAPCVLPLLPIILGGSLTGEKRDKWRPYIITASLVASLILFTILLKASTVFIGIDPRLWAIGSGILVIILGLFMLFPDLWAQIIGKLGIEHRSQGLLGKAYKQENGVVSAILIGAALGPIFSSCSPTYAWVIATVLPASAALGVFYLAIYCVGVATSLLAIALLGRKLLERIKWASDPKGWFQRGIAVLFILVGVFVATGWDKKIQTYLVEKDIFSLIKLEEKLVPGQNDSSNQSNSDSSDKKKYNVSAYDAPELQGIADWINSDPTTLKQLEGKVVLIDFWTYSCINCQRTQPYLNAWYDKYHDDGFQIVGVHAPEFAFEKVSDNVQKAVKEAGIKYPVALDNTFSTWKAYDNRFWPAKYLIDKDGQIRYTHFGEGEYDETEKVIQDLLKETGKSITDKIEKDAATTAGQQGQSPETYLGYERGQRFKNTEQFKDNVPVEYSLADTLGEHEWSLGGIWQIGATQTVSTSDNALLRFKFSAKEVYLVMNGPTDKPVTLKLNGQSVTASSNGGKDVDARGQVHLNGARLYKLVSLPAFTRNQVLDISVPKGTTVNAFTFGG